MYFQFLFASISNNRLRSLEDRKQFDTIYTDFSKAFDSIDHRILLKKIELIGLDSNFVHWIKSYLMDRTQYVLLNGHRSKPISVYSGVPQGSYLGPLLFIIYINDIVNIIKYSKCLLYADDLKIFKVIETSRDAFDLQEDLNSIVDWCEANKLKLNLNKCHVMSFIERRMPTCMIIQLMILN